MQGPPDGQSHVYAPDGLYVRGPLSPRASAVSCNTSRSKSITAVDGKRGQYVFPHAHREWKGVTPTATTRHRSGSRGVLPEVRTRSDRVGLFLRLTCNMATAMHGVPPVMETALLLSGTCVTDKLVAVFGTKQVHDVNSMPLLTVVGVRIRTASHIFTGTVPALCCIRVLLTERCGQQVTPSAGQYC